MIAFSRSLCKGVVNVRNGHSGYIYNLSRIAKRGQLHSPNRCLSTQSELLKFSFVTNQNRIKKYKKSSNRMTQQMIQHKKCKNA